ncbi:MAG: secondary thiamine-phosphate synthase enzyme YjbQ [bacterium JZ-2024 1]
MKTHTEYLWFETSHRVELVNLTRRVNDIVRNSGIQEGFVLVSAMHITAAVFVNDEEEGLKRDILDFLERLAPQKAPYRHHATGEDNGYAHLWNLLIGHQVLMPVSGGKLDLGPWQQIFYGEFDGRRRKRVLVKVFGE